MGTFFCWLAMRTNRTQHFGTNRLARYSAAVLAGALMAGCDPANDAPGGESVLQPAPSTVTTASDASQEELEAEFNSSRAILAEAKTQAVFSQFKAGQQVQLTSGWNNLTIQATGDDPQFHLPAFAAGRHFIIQVMVKSPADTLMQMYYLRHGQSEYNGDQMRTCRLKQGENVVYFQFGVPDIIDPIRVDIGLVPGAYVVESMVARGIPGK